MDNEVACLTKVSIVIKWFEQKSLQFPSSCLELWLSFFLDIIFLTDRFLRRRKRWLPDFWFVLCLDKSDPDPVSANHLDLCPRCLAALTLEVASPCRHMLLLSHSQTRGHGSKVLFKVGSHCSSHVCCNCCCCPSVACCCWGWCLFTAGRSCSGLRSLNISQLIRNITQNWAWCYNKNALWEAL